MMRVEMFREMADRDRGVAVAMWLDAGEVFSVTAHEDPDWSVLAFKACAGRRPMIVRGAAEKVAAEIGAHVDRQRRPARRARV